MTGLRELVDDLRATYGELFPNRNPETMRISDDVLALGELLRREMRMAARITESHVAQAVNRHPQDPE